MTTKKRRQKIGESGLKQIAVSPWVYEDLQDLGFTSDSFNTVLKRILFYLQGNNITREVLTKYEPPKHK